MRIPLHPGGDGHLILKEARLLADADAAPSTQNYRLVRVGIADSNGVDYYGTYDGTKDGLTVKDPFSLTGDVSVTIPAGRALVADVDLYGDASINGLSVYVRIGNDYEAPAYRVEDPQVRAAVDALADHFANTRSGEQEFTVPLRDAVSITQVRHAMFQGRMEYSSATQLKMVGYSGRYIDVAGTFDRTRQSNFCNSPSERGKPSIGRT